ncbi:hypothetical protein PG994_009318 [Apiospora phragmitis]|uniref:Uncharacterized protein n=1 Tax=Apiospora phragmitis TaxID=2905665 RepID=A0ABR1UIY5_9PEZI
MSFCDDVEGEVCKPSAHTDFIRGSELFSCGSVLSGSMRELLVQSLDQLSEKQLAPVKPPASWPAAAESVSLG